jgi:hypothetical protein
MRFARHELGSTWLPSRRLVAPEPLEQRNAPSTLLPWGELLASPFADQGDLWAEFQLAIDTDLTVSAARPAIYWSPLLETLAAVEQDFGIAWTDEVITPVQQPVTTPQVSTELPATTVAYEAAAIDAAFEEAGTSEEVPPAVIQPVIMDPDSEFNQPNFGQAMVG